MRLTEYFLQLLTGRWLAAVIKVRITTNHFPGPWLISSNWQYLFHNRAINRMLWLMTSQCSKQAIQSSLPIFPAQRQALQAFQVAEAKARLFHQ